MHPFLLNSLVLLLFVISSFSSRYDGFVDYSEKALRRWDPNKIDEECPVFVMCEPTQSGLGDKLEHYVYSMNVAKMYLATMVIDAEDFILLDANTHHLGMNEYHRIASQILGLHLNVNQTYLRKNYPGLKKTIRTFHQVLDHQYRMIDQYKEGLRPDKIPCGTVIYSDIGSCGMWCPLHFHQGDFNFVENVRWLLHSDRPKEECYGRNLGFDRKNAKNDHTINILWHVRKGDITLHARNENYYTSVLDRLLDAIGSRREQLGRNVILKFISEGNLSNIQQVIPAAEFNHGVNSLEDDVCFMLTSDILITDGSSLVYVVTFGSSDSPLIIEERRKENHQHLEGGKLLQTPMKGIKQQHIFTENIAILLDDGNPRESKFEMDYRIKTYIRSLGN